MDTSRSVGRFVGRTVGDGVDCIAVMVVVVVVFVDGGAVGGSADLGGGGGNNLMFDRDYFCLLLVLSILIENKNKNELINAKVNNCKSKP